MESPQGQDAAPPLGNGDPAHHWELDPTVTYLNHGSFGACPRPVLEAQQALRDRMEAEPVRFFTRELPELMVETRHALGRFVGADPEGLALVPNVTTALNAVLRSAALPEGAELLVTDHEYNAARNALEFAARERGCSIAVAQVPFPLEQPEQVVDAVLARVGPRTRLALLDHVTSQTALVFPIAELVGQLRERGVDVLVDGAHAPGMLPLDLAALAPAYYAGNCHKWLCAPKGAGFLWVREDHRQGVRPTVISHGANAPGTAEERFRLEFDWTGTDDPTAALAVPEALRFLETLLPGGWPALMERNHALALEGRRIVAEALEVDLPCPDALIGSMASLPVPAGFRRGTTAPSPLSLDPLHDALFRQHAIEVPLLFCPAHRGPLLRISAQLYNQPSDYRRLAQALRALKT